MRPSVSAKDGFEMTILFICLAALSAGLCLWMELAIRKHVKDEALQTKKKEEGFFINEYLEVGPEDER